MPLRLIVGPPGAGKTRRLVSVARAAAQQGRRVTWVALPHQRDAVHRRLADDGPLLGVAVVSAQRLMYQILAEALVLPPLVMGTERLALVGRALLEARGVVPSPGEARLFAAAVAEAKRHGLSGDELASAAASLARGDAADAAEARRLAEVQARYQASLGGRMDYDDVRAAALELARAGRARLPAEVVIIDGFRELGPLDLALYRALAQRSEVHLALPTAPPGIGAALELAPRPVALRSHRFANPVAEARWVLRALKRELASGVPAPDLALIVPPGGTRALVPLADEFGVPLVDETPMVLSDTREGRVLLELLELAERPTAARLLAVPELEPLATAALERGVAGRDAIGALAEELGLGASWRDLLAFLTPGSDAADWAGAVVDFALRCAARLPAAGEAVDDSAVGPSAIRDLLLVRALEAMRLGDAEAVRPWWAALVEQTHIARRPRSGVALLTPDAASGRRFRAAYLLGAASGAYSAGEREDYFLPEDARRPWEAVLAAATAGAAPHALPRRHRGRDTALAAELLARGDRVVVTFAEADRAGPLRPDPLLVRSPVPAPRHPAGSDLETTTAPRFRTPAGPAAQRNVDLEALRRSDPCRFRVWAERFTLVAGSPPPGVRLRRALTSVERLDEVRRLELASEHPEAAGWLEEHAERLGRHRFGVRLPGRAAAPVVRLDAVERAGGLVHIVRFVAEGEDPLAVLDPKRRWSELYAARLLLRRESVHEVRICAWPLLGPPIEVTREGMLTGRTTSRLERLAGEIDRSWRRWREDATAPTPGRHCARCTVRDLCREAPRT